MADTRSVQAPFSWTQSTRKELARQLHTSMLSFQRDVVANMGAIPPGEVKAWVAFRDQWAKWWGDTGITTWLWDSTVTIIEGYSVQLVAWRQKFSAWTGKEPSGVDPVSLTPWRFGAAVDVKLPDQLPKVDIDWMPLLWIGCGLVVIGGIVYVVKRRASKTSGGYGDLGALGTDSGFFQRATTDIQLRAGNYPAFEAAMERATQALSDGKSVFVTNRFLLEAERAARSVSHAGDRKMLLGTVADAKRAMAIMGGYTDLPGPSSSGLEGVSLVERHLTTAADQYRRGNARSAARALAKAEASLRVIGSEAERASTEERVEAARKRMNLPRGTLTGLTGTDAHVWKQDLDASQRRLEKARSKASRLPAGQRDKMQADIDAQLMQVHRQRQMRPVRDFDDQGEVALVDDVLDPHEYDIEHGPDLKLQTIEIGAEDDPGERDEDEDEDEDPRRARQARLDHSEQTMRGLYEKWGLKYGL